ncbi:DNA polymerase III subunit gamma/tau [Dissulfuribacter thermophilus]|nr:DNA polymerase III subunit gamma/tau [Dissulfuribacter thermophilus]
MSYLVLARKWRPQTFGEVIGQSHVTRTLQNAIQQGRLAHALIFSGARGVGKTSIARIVSKAINCENGPSKEPCNKCGICKEITQGASVDVVEIDGASNRGIDEIRRLRETILFQPVRCRYKVYIIDEVHMLTREAFNALLKTLEEPPSHVYFMFATTEASKLPDTIRSRCQHYEFRLLTPKEIGEHLTRICQAENLGLEPQAIDLVAKAAQGSLRDSLSLLDQVVAFGAKTKDQISEALGLIPGDVIKNIVVAILNGDPKDAILTIDRVHRFGGDLQRLTHDMLYFLRDLLLFKELGVDGESLYSNPLYELQGVDEQLIDTAIISELIHMLSNALEAIKRSSTPRILLETIVIRMSRLKEIVKIDTVIDKLEGVLKSGQYTQTPPMALGTAIPGATNSSRSTVPTKTTPSQAPSDTPLKKVTPSTRPNVDHAPAREKDVQGFMEYLQNVSPPLWSILDRVKALEIDNGILRIFCNSSFQENRLKDPKCKKELEQHSTSYFGQKIALELNGSSASKAKDKKKVAKNAVSQRLSAREALKAHPLVKEAIKTFGAKVEDIKLFE